MMDSDLRSRKFSTDFKRGRARPMIEIEIPPPQARAGDRAIGLIVAAVVLASCVASVVAATLVAW